MSDATSFTLVRAAEDAALVADAVRTVVAELVGEADRTMVLEDLGDEVTVSAVVDACQTPPFLGDRRVVVVRDAGRWASADLDPLLAYVADPLATTRLVVVGGGGQLSQRLANAAKKFGRIVESAAPGGKARTGWMVDRLRAGPVVVDAAGGALLGEHLGEDLGRLPAILEMLQTTYGDGAKVGVAEIAPILGEAGGVAPWDLTDAIDRGDASGALRALHRMVGAGQRHPLVVLASLHKHCAAMLRLDGAGSLSDAEAAALTGMAPYPARKAMEQARRLGSAAVARAITLVAEADLDLRGVKEWPDGLVLEVLVARLSRLARRSARPAARGSRGSRA